MLSVHRGSPVRRLPVVVMLLAAGIGTADAGQPIDPAHSTVTVRVFKAGAFSAFADNHVILAPLSSGSLDDREDPSVELVVDVRAMRVLDPQLSAHDRAKVEARMLGPEVLDANRFDQIRFRSTKVRPIEHDGWLVSGRLTIHGRTRPVVVKVARDGERFQGSLTVNQTDYGITPIRIAGGLVSVKDAVAVDFDIRPSTANPTER